MKLPVSTAPAPDAASMQCIACGRVQADPGGWYQCAACGDLLELIPPQAPSAAIVQSWPALWRSRRSSRLAEDLSGVWRFRELLPHFPLAPRGIVTLREGNTPLYDLPRLARAAGVAAVWAKHQGMNPTGSFKDLGMTVAVTRAQALGAQWVACASTGNTSASMAAYAAQAGLRSLVLIPAGKIAWGKLAQSLDYGALTCQLDTDFDGCVRILRELVRRAPVYVVNSINPYRVEGQKIMAAEILEQMAWQSPDHILIPGGNLANSSALGKGWLELAALGLAAKIPRISIIQAEGASPLVDCWRDWKGEKLQPRPARTLATAIQIGNPASWKKAVRVLRSTGGECLAVNEMEIAQAKAEIGRQGIGCEPASAVTWAGAKKLIHSGWIQPGQSVMLILTGHTLKDAEYILGFHRGEIPGPESGSQAALAGLRHPPRQLPATVEAVAAALETAGRP